MKKYLFIYKECVKIALSKTAAYRLNFVLSAIITLASNLAVPLVTVLVYNAGASFPNWDFYEVLLIQAVFTISSGIANAIMGSVMWVTLLNIREGTFETILLKPLNPLFYITAANFQPESLGLIAGGAVFFIIAVRHVTITSVYVVLQFAILFLAGVAVMLGMILIMAATSFKWVGNSRIPEIFQSMETFGKYPIGIFPTIVQAVISFIFPVGMIGFFPAAALLGRANWTYYAAILPCVLFMAFGVLLYRHMIRLYEGVGG